MSAVDAARRELEDMELKLRNARNAAAAAAASDKDKADLKLIEQECIAARQNLRRQAESRGAAAVPTDPLGKLDRKLDEALEASFPGSDPVSFIEAAPVKQKDRALPEVRLAEAQQPEKTAAARRKSGG